MKRLLFPKLLFTGVLLTFVIVFVCAANAQSLETQSNNTRWIGSYEFFDAEKGAPKNQPNNFVTYTLIVSQSGDRLTARFTADGTQISDDYECRLETAAGSIKVFFVKDVGEANKAVPLKAGDLIFTLTKNIVGKKTRYLFGKGKYEIYPLSAPLKNKIYFDRKK